MLKDFAFSKIKMCMVLTHFEPINAERSSKNAQILAKFSLLLAVNESKNPKYYLYCIV